MLNLISSLIGMPALGGLPALNRAPTFSAQSPAGDPANADDTPLEEVADVLLPNSTTWLDPLRDFLTTTIEQNSLTDYVVAAGIFGAILAVALGLKFGLTYILRRGIEDRPHSRKAIAARVVGRTWTLYITLVALLAGAATLALPEGLISTLRVLTLVFFFLQAGAWISALISGYGERYAARHGEDDPQATTGLTIAQLVGRAIVWSIVLLLILDNIGVDVTALVAGLGIGGIAIGLAAQNVLGDLFGSLAIVMDKPFVRGDFIILSDKHMGHVEKIGLKTTRIRSLSGEQLIVANTDLLTSRIHNYKRMWQRRIVFKLGVVYQTSHDKLERIPGIIKSIIDAQDGARLDRTNFSGFGDFALMVETVWFVTSADYNEYMAIQECIYLAIHKAFEEEGIEFAYPTQTVMVEGIGGATDPSATEADRSQDS